MVLTQWETLCGLFFAFFEKIVVPILTSGGLVSLPALDIAARNSGVHDLADSTGLPLCQDIGVAQCFRVKLLGTHPVTCVVLQKGVDHASLCILLHEVLLMGLQRFLHGVAERQPVVAAVVNRHGFCPELIDIGARFLLVVQNVGLSQFRIHRDGEIKRRLPVRSRGKKSCRLVVPAKMHWRRRSAGWVS